jgi:cation diffusion facilitator CzcD-associated flavoprotein CzcO
MSNLDAKSNIQPAVPTSYSQVACIGAGFSAIGVGSSLKRWYGITDVTFFERRESSGGTWLANNYPGQYSG